MINIDDRLLAMLNEKQLWLLMHLVQRINKDGVCWPALETICKDTRWKDWRTVNKTRDELVAIGILEVKTRMKNEGGQTSNMFILKTDLIGVYKPANELQRIQLAPLHTLQPPPLHEMQGEVLSNEVLSMSSPVSPEPVSEKKERFNSKVIKETIEYFNLICGTNYKASTKKTIRALNARIEEGYGLNDFKEVIDHNFPLWKNNPVLRPYVRPWTFFSTNFENYINVARGVKFANTDDTLNDCELTREEQTAYNEYIQYIHKQYADLYRSECKVLSKSDWIDYKNCTSMRGLPNLMNLEARKALLVWAHERLNKDQQFRSQYESVIQCYYARAKAIVRKEATI